MRISTALAVLALVTMTVTTAHAQHDHHGGHPPAPTATEAPPAFEVELSLLGATFDQMLYEGEYAGLGAGIVWQHDRLSLHAAVRAYHLTRNGAAVDGLGDVSAGADLLAYASGRWTTGGGVAVTLPTGESMTGLGMGHPMLMPALWATRDDGRTLLGVSAGWCGAVGGGEGHDHGAWPLVEPMSSSELMAGVHLDRVVRGPFHAGASVRAAVPLDGGNVRVVGAVGGGWRRQRAETGVELEAGLAGDPFKLRALIVSALRF